MSRRVWTVLLSITAAVLVMVPGSALASTAPTPVWTQESPSTSPSVRLNASMAYDPDTGQLVLFGGENGNGVLGDTWVFSGNTWNKLSPATSPPARSNAVMAYDAGTGQLVLFGGIGSNGNALQDTWVWNGGDWTQLSPPSSPSPRHDSTMAYDQGTGQLVLFGGSAGEPLGDTWVWNGSTWTQESPAHSPAPRSEASMDDDTATGQLILWGGEDPGGSLLTDTEEWNGFTWTQVAGGIPPGRIHGSMSFDEGTGQLVLFGGQESGGSGVDTWAWAPVLRSQTVTFSSTAPAATFGGPTYTPRATGGGSGNTVTFSVDAATTNSACTISSGVVSFPNTGTCVIDASQAGNGDYAAGGAQQTFTVAQASQSITFTSTAPTGETVGGASYTPKASGGASGNAVTFSIDLSTTNAACSIASGVVSFAHAGSCVIDANQAGNADYAAAMQKQQTFTVAKGSQTVAFTSTAPTAATVGGASYTPTASDTAALTVTFTVDSATTKAACSITSGVVSFAHAGSCVIDANQAGNADYAAAMQKQQTITVAKAAQSVAFTSAAPTAATAGGASYTPTATGGASKNEVVFTIDPSTTNGACAISNGLVSFLAAGSCVIDANQAGNADYSAAAQVQQTIAVSEPVTTTTTPTPTTTTPTPTTTSTTTPTTSTTTTPTSTTTTPTTTTTTPTTTTTTTTTTKPTPAVVRAVVDDQQVVLSSPSSAVCTASPVSVSLGSSLIKGSKAAKATFVKAAFYVDKGVKHSRKVKVHGKVKTVVSYTANVTVTKASATTRLKAAKGRHTLKVIVSYRTRVTTNHKTRTVVVTKTITAALNIC